MKHWNHDSLLDLRVANEILAGETYPSPPLDPRIEVKTVVDIGAHVGAAAMWFHRLWPEAEIYCYEPAEDSVQLLRKNAPFAHVRQCALSDYDGKAVLYKGPEATAARSLYGHERLCEVDVVDAAGEFASRFTGNAPCVIKIDTEGCEVRIARALRGWLHLAKVVYIEYHRWEDRQRIEEMLDNPILFHADVGYSVNRGQMGYISRHAICPKALEMLHLRREM
jgi:FkbM family methyltransferase